MTKWLVIETQQYSENSPDYGCGDYPEQIEYIAAVVEGDTLRQAQNAAKKVLPGVRFGGMFSPDLIQAADPQAKRHIKPADIRLRRMAVHRHRASLAALAPT